MLDYIWNYMDYMVVLLVVSQGVVYCRLYLEYISLKKQNVKINENYKFIKDNYYSIKSINKYIDDQAFKKMQKKSPNLTFYPCDEPLHNHHDGCPSCDDVWLDRRDNDRRVSNRRCE